MEAPDLAPERAAGLRRNPKLLFWKNFAQFAMFLNPAWALFLMSRGADGRQIFLLGTVYAAVAAVTEIPTGWVGDRLGRRRTLMIGTVFLVLAAALQIWAAGFVLLAVVLALRSAGDAFHSGTEEALVVESARELGHAEDVLRNAGTGSAGQYGAKALTPLAFVLGSLLWTGAPLYVFLAALTFAVSLLAFIPIRMMTEPSHASRGATGVRAAMRPFRDHPILWGFTFHGGLRLTSVLVFFMAYSARLHAAGIGGFWLGLFYGLFHFSMFLHSRYAWKLAKRFGSPTLVNGMTVAVVILGLAVAFIGVPWLLYAAALAAFILSDARGNYYVHHVNAFIPSEVRATTLSLMRMFQRLAEIPIMFLAAWLASRNLDLVFVLFAAINGLLLLAPFPPLSHIRKAKEKLPPHLR
ncbi:MAG TPA: MFS transporter [Candidatus Eisenbacteria bacterium]|nr:MFS transporter [Candidatus Eisenbacteria bacterium]